MSELNGDRSAWLRCYRCWSQNLEIQIHYDAIRRVDPESQQRRREERPVAIVPVAAHARSIVAVEMVAGVLYVALVVSRLVGLVVSRQAMKVVQEEPEER